jgi:c-di-GMP-binding flagellar brake protein YcgR
VSDNRRHQYRVTPEIERDVSVAVRIQSNDLQDIALLDVSAGGVAFAVETANKLDVELSDTILMSFESKRLGRPLEIPGTVQHIHATMNQVFYGVSFEGWGDTRLNLTPKLRALFNEREAVRVEPREEEDVDIQINWSNGSSINGMMRDISVLGVGMWVSEEDESILTANDEVSLNFQLGPESDSLVLQARLRYTSMVGEQTRVGIEIMEQQPAPMSGSRKAITDYVMKRQLEIARVDAERRRAMQAHYTLS